MNPQWRTRTVTALCESMRQTEDYSACPILADALQDAGCEDEQLLTRLRTGDWTPILERTVAVIYSDRTTAAVAWMDDFAARVGYNYATVIKAGRQFLKTNERFCENDNWDATNAMHDKNIRQDYWKNFGLITGIQTTDTPGSAFTCPC
jgi:hypothetical protein